MNETCGPDVPPGYERLYPLPECPLIGPGSAEGDTDRAVSMMIGAIALAHQLILVTHNTQEFSRIPGIHLEDWETLSSL